MLDPGAELSREVRRIVASPYPPSLAKLANLCGSVGPLTVRNYLHNLPPCDLNKLASTVTAALPLWQNCVTVLHSFAHSPEFANRLLLHSPGLLDALLTKANSSDEAFVQYAQICVTLLSRPLPESLPLPANAQPFFLGAFERAIHMPQVDTLNPVYRMLNGACRGLLSTLSSETRRTFDAKLRHLLSSSNAAQDSMLMLWCFGITILAEHPEATNPSSTLAWETAAGRKLFGSEINKTINLAYLNVVWAAKGDVGVSDDEALEGIRIATHSLRFVDKRILERWPASGDFAKATFQKLPSKILRKNINPAVQLEALAFYAMVAGRNLQPGLVKAYENALPNVLDLVDAEFLKNSISTSLPLFTPHMDESCVRKMVLMIFKANISPISAREMANMRIMVDELCLIVTQDRQLRSMVLAAISSDDMQGAIQQFLQADVKLQGSVDMQTCKSYATRMFRELASATVALCLTAALSNDTPAPLPTLLCLELVKKQQQLPLIPDECNHLSCPIKAPSVSLFQQECTPLSGVHLQDWRGRLMAELENQGFYQRDSVIRSVAQICHDLETRCQTVEEPLRHEKEKSSRLGDEVCELQQKLALVELKKWEDGEHISALDAENDRLEKERDQITGQLAQLKKALGDANEAAERTLCQLHEQHGITDAQLRSTILTQEEDLRSREREIEALRKSLVNNEEEIHQLRSTIEDVQDDVVVYKNETAELTNAKNTLSEELDRVREGSRSLQNQADVLQTQLADARRSLNDQQNETLELSGEVGRLQSECASFKTRLQDTESELLASNSRLEDLQKRHQELAKSSTEALEKLEKQFENELDATESRAAAEKHCLDSDLQEALHHGQEMTEAYEELQKELQALRTSIPPLNARLQELTNAYNDQGEELEDLRDWKNQLMVSVSLPPERGHRRTRTRLAEDNTHPNTPGKHRRRTSSHQAQDPARKISESAQHMGDVANASFTSTSSQSSRSGPTPKRVKARPSFKVPSMHTPYSKKSFVISKSATKSLSPGKRPALESISPNRRHTTVGFDIGENEEEPGQTQDLPLRKRHVSIQNTEQPDLSMDDFTAAMPLTPGAFTSGTGRPPDEGDITEL